MESCDRRPMKQVKADCIAKAFCQVGPQSVVLKWCKLGWRPRTAVWNTAAKCSFIIVTEESHWHSCALVNRCSPSSMSVLFPSTTNIGPCASIRYQFLVVLNIIGASLVVIEVFIGNSVDRSCIRRVWRVQRLWGIHHLVWDMNTGIARVLIGPLRS